MCSTARALQPPQCGAMTRRQEKRGKTIYRGKTNYVRRVRHGKIVVHREDGKWTAQGHGTVKRIVVGYFKYALAAIENVEAALRQVNRGSNDSNEPNGEREIRILQNAFLRELDVWQVPVRIDGDKLTKLICSELRRKQYS